MNRKIKDMALISIFSALIIMLALVPGIGYIPVGPIRATTIHIPVIIGSIIFGPKKGAILGFVFGLTSLINNTVSPTITSFVFSPFYAGGNLWSLVICFLPRILIGVVPYYVYNFLKKFIKNEHLDLGVAGFLGSITNTVLVMNLIFFCFKNQYAAANNIAPGELYDVILGINSINGVVEAVLAMLVTSLVTKVLLRVYRG